jgi:hypothetical protein
MVVSHNLVKFEPILPQTFSLSQKQDPEYPWNTLMSAAPRPAGSLLDATHRHLSYAKIGDFQRKKKIAAQDQCKAELRKIDRNHETQPGGQ